MESLDKHVRSLTDILEEEYSHYNDVFRLIKDEQSVLVNAKLDELEKNLYEQQKIVEKINKFEIKRLEILNVIAIYLGTVPEKLKMSFIAQQVDAELSEKLLKLETQFKSVLQEIMKLNRTNKFLINKSLHFIKENVQVFFGAIEEKGMYSPGEKKNLNIPSSKRMVDWKA